MKKLLVMQLLDFTIYCISLSHTTEEAEEAQYVHIDGCYQFRGCTGASFSKAAVSAKSACCDRFGGQSYILSDGGICRDW